MAVVVEQTIPFSPSVLDLDNPARWTTLLPLIRPSLKAIPSSQGNTILVDASLAKSKYVRVAAVGRAGNLSSKILESRHVSVIVTKKSGRRTTVEEIQEALETAGFLAGPGLVVIRSSKARKSVEAGREDVADIEVSGDLELDHLLHILGSAAEDTRCVGDL